jgi:hypothetical protein
MEGISHNRELRGFSMVHQAPTFIAARASSTVNRISALPSTSRSKVPRPSGF